MFKKCSQVEEWLKAFDGEWMFAGGWAIDLHIGEETRFHEDMEIAIFLEDQHRLQEALKFWDLFVVRERELVAWGNQETLHLPIHEIHATSPEGNHLEILLNERSKCQWKFRRSPSITFHLDRMKLRSAQGFPYLNPEIVLLYKSTKTRDTDHQDFQHVFPYLNEHQKEWLKQALMHHQPEHPWLEALLY